MNLDFTNPAMMIGAAVVFLLIVFLAVVIIQRRRRKRTRNLKMRFGHEYDLLLRQLDSRKNTEGRLLAREKRVEQFRIRDLKPNESAQYAAAWEVVQSRFVNQPKMAVLEADELINSILRARGFPVGPFEQRAADLSVDHSNLIESYRAAYEITLRAGKNSASTEELRMAMLYYHALLDDLVQLNTHAVAA